MTNLLIFHDNLLDAHFAQTDLGILYKAIPFEDLAATIVTYPSHEVHIAPSNACL